MPLGTYLKKLNSLPPTVVLRNSLYRKISEDKRQAMILSWLRQKYQPEIKKYAQKSETAQAYANPKEGKIWVCWLQGQENAPQIVKYLLAEMKKNANGHELIVLTSQNIADFVKIPPQIQEKYERKIISPAHYSDFVRIELLKNYGGLWLDATVLLTQPLPDAVFQAITYHPKNLNAQLQYPVAKFIPNFHDWTNSLLACQPHALLAEFLSEVLKRYLIEFDAPLDYFLVFYLAKIAREDLAAVKDAFEKLPSNNAEYELFSILKQDTPKELQAANQNLLPNLLQHSQSFAFKLNYAVPYVQKIGNYELAQFHPLFQFLSALTEVDLPQNSPKTLAENSVSADRKEK